MSTRSRLLGMAFASADVLFEMDGTRLTFAVGAGPAPGVDPGDAWTGQGLDSLFDPAGAEALKAVIRDLPDGARSAPVEVRARLADGARRKGVVRAFRLPELAPFVSCAVLWEGAVIPAASGPRPLLDAGGLLKRLGALLSQGGTAPELTVDFVQVPGLDGTDPRLRQVGARIEARLQAASHGGASAARLSADRFALMRDADDVADLAAEVRDLARAEGLDLSPIATRAAVGEAEAAVAVRTLRFALEDCLKDGAAAGERFGERLRRTVQDADRFRAIVRERQFALAWQPIVALDTRAAHHFEALARFGGADQAPVGAIAMAEEIGLIEAFDLAVAEKAILQLRRPGFGLTKAAINVSGGSLSGDGYVEGLLRMTAAAPEIRKRLMIEITETADIADLDGADRRLRALRQAGIQICLDDYGVGATSMAYLRKLPIDVLKIDGAFVREIGTDPRVRTLAGHLIELCRDLKILTVAEMVETEAQAGAVAALGVDYGQGWLFGRPAEAPLVAGPAAARRRGETVAWG